MILKRKKKILVGLSGGVDSAVTVKLLQEDGYEVIGLFLEMLSNNNFNKSEKVAKQLGVRLVTKDIKKVFQKEIVNDFLRNYSQGKTPNPCVLCNPQIKFKYLLDVADELGIKYVATGHYARIEKQGKIDNKNSKFEIRKAKDITKDQSYFLYGLLSKELGRIKLPLGNLLKKEVKQIAENAKIQIPEGESQDVCFLENGRLDVFLKNNLPKKYFQKGGIIDENNQIVGEHQGLVIYTIGQRKGLNVGGDGPFYVVAKDWENNILRVSRQRQSLNRKVVDFSGVNWLNAKPIDSESYQIKLRYQMQEIDAIIKKVGTDKWRATLMEQGWAVAPGQSLVIYDGDVLVGGGIILDGNQEL